VKYSRTVSVWLTIGLAIATTCSLTGCAKKAPWGSIEEGLILEYRMVPGGTMKYEMAQEAEQKFEMMGQQVTMVFDKAYGFSLASRGLREGNHDLTITIESMDAGVSSPQGDFPANVEAAVGKSFDLTVSPLGKEQVLSGADSVRYSLGMAGTRDVSSDFQGLFPDLAGRPVKVGDTWNTKDAIDVKDENADIRIATVNVNTFDGFETVNGMECARVAAEVTGTVTGEGSQMGSNLSFSGSVEGTEVWYFAYKEGLLIKSTSELSIQTTITVSGAQQMTIPMTQQLTTETVLVE
jgi:hypothetical protein